MKKSVFFCFTHGQTYVRFLSLLKMRFQLGFTHEKEKSFSPEKILIQFRQTFFIFDQRLD